MSPNTYKMGVNEKRCKGKIKKYTAPTRRIYENHKGKILNFGATHSIRLPREFTRSPSKAG